MVKCNCVNGMAGKLIYPAEMTDILPPHTALTIARQVYEPRRRTRKPSNEDRRVLMQLTQASDRQFDSQVIDDIKKIQDKLDDIAQRDENLHRL